MDTFLTYAIFGCALLLGLSGFFDRWATLSQRSTFKGGPILFLSLLGKHWFKVIYFLTFTFMAFILGKCNSDRTDSKTKQELTLRDLTHQRHDDSLQLSYKKDIQATNDANIKSFSKSLQEYHLTYNNEQKKVYALIRDSQTREIPSLDIFAGERKVILSNDSLYLTLNFENSGNCPLMVNSRIYSACCFSSYSTYFSKSNAGLKNRSIGTAFTVGVPLIMTLGALPDKIYILIMGSYANLKGGLLSKVDQLLIWDIKTNSIGVPTDIPTKDSMENLIKVKLRI